MNRLLDHAMQLSTLLTKLEEIENPNKQSIFESIGQGDQYFRTWEKEIHPVLCEVALQPDQIQQLFKSIEAGAGRSGLGKAVDAVKGASEKISDVWFNKFGGMLQNSAPVQAFDQKWEDIKSKVAAKNPELAAKLAKYGEFAKNNPKLHKFLLAIAGSAAAALGVAAAGGIGAGALAVGTGTGIAVGILNIADRLLQGQKASTAIGRGATAGAVAGITAAGLSALGNWLGSLREKVIPVGDTGLEKVSWNASRSIDMPGLYSKETTQGFNVLVDAESAQQIRQYMELIKGGDPSAFVRLQNLAREIASPEYKQTVDSAMKGALELAKSNDSLLQWIKGVTQAASAAGGGAAGAAVGNPKQATTESLNSTQINELFGITGNKVDASTLQKAWEKAGSPTDSAAIADLLKQNGVDQALIDKTFQDMKISTKSAPAQNTDLKTLMKQIQGLAPAQKQQLMKALQKKLGVA